MHFRCTNAKLKGYVDIFDKRVVGTWKGPGHSLLSSASTAAVGNGESELGFSERKQFRTVPVHPSTIARESANASSHDRTSNSMSRKE